MTSEPDLSPDERDAVTAPPTGATLPPPSPGAQLRQAREAAHLTLEDFAAQTKLALGTLQALEADDFGALLEPVYVRGYYRKCGRLLGLSEASLIEAYNARVKQTQPQAPARIRLSAGTAEGGGGGFGRWLGLLIVIIIIGLLAYLWFTRPSASPVAAEGSGQPIPDVAITTTPAVEAMGRSEPDPTAAPESEAAVPSPPPVEVTTEPTPAAVSGEPTVRLQFRETSWVRINDADGQALLNGLMDGGTSQTVSGAGPLSLFFGNAPGVVVELDGQRIDLSPYTQSNSTARLTLPPSN